MFDAPVAEKTELRWQGRLDIEDKPWCVGLIVGPSGCGKSTVARSLFGEKYHPLLNWSGASVIDDTAPDETVEAIGSAFSSVGFNTIPAWVRPFGVLSNGEQFRCDLARRLLELDSPVVVDEFSSVVDRQVAMIGANAVQKYVRRHDKRFVAITCHYDVENWLQPDWILEPATMTVRWRRSLQRRPTIDCIVARAKYDVWKLFAPFHYMSADLNRSARLFCSYVDNMPACLVAVLHMPHPKTRNLKAVSRVVTLPDFQGVGLLRATLGEVASAHKTLDLRLRTYPAHPWLIRAFDRWSEWSLVSKPRARNRQHGPASTVKRKAARSCGIFEYCGEAMGSVADAQRFIEGV